MKRPTDYQPCFAHVPDDWQGRWTLLRRFVRRWYGVSLRPVGARSTLVEIEKHRIACRLPPSLCQWIAFAEELTAKDVFGRILRDIYDVSKLEAHAAILFLRQAEDDVYWAVKADDLDRDDPPVNTYCLDYETNQFVPGGLVAPSLTSFILRRMAHLLHGLGGGFRVNFKLSDAFLDEMRRSFVVASEYDNLRLFESQDILAMIEPAQFGPEDHNLLVEVWSPIPMVKIPKCVRAHAKNGGAFHGVFARYSSRRR